MSNEFFRNYSYLSEDNNRPVAIILPTDQEVVVGSIVKLDGRSSIDPENTGLSYEWKFTQVPVGSQVENFGFTALEDDSSRVSFAPDVTGAYKVELIVTDATLPSLPAEAVISVRVILVPYHQGFIPDASFIWNYLSDFWTMVPDKKRFETFWSASIQIAAAEQLKLYQYQYNKSIRDIQDTIQKRWLSFSPSISLDRESISFVLADDMAGLTGSTMILDPNSGVPIVFEDSYSNVITVPINEVNFITTTYGKAVSLSRLIRLSNRSYSMRRAANIARSINYGSDGSSSGISTFNGSEFTSDMVGATLRILFDPTSPNLIGDYKIVSFVSPSEITIEVPAGVTWNSHADIVYTVIPYSTTHSSFFATKAEVPAGLENQSWRFSSTLISTNINFEQEGVSPGDIIEVEVTRTDNGALSNFFIQVVSVDNNKLGFVANLDDLIDGISADWMTDDIKITLAADLGIQGIVINPDGSLSYKLDAALIEEEVSSISFKRSYFETELTPEDDISVGPFSIRIRPVRIIRNSKILVDSSIKSIPILQEYVKQPQIARTSSGTVLITDGNSIESGRDPYLLSENLDYILDDESTVFGICNITQGSDEITIPFGDLLDRAIQEGDILTTTVGITDNEFNIIKVLSSEKVRVHPIPTFNSVNAPFSIERRIEGKYLRFVSEIFTKTSPAPERLWAEVVYFDNNEAIENNFGVLVGLRREDLEKVGSSLPYKSAVAGLMYALSRGPTIYNIELSAQILIGLPFSQTTGIITEINRSYRIREDGSPKYGRILIESTDSNGTRLGITNIYLYPHGAQVKDVITDEWVPVLPDLSGIAINPETNAEYKVGDVVAQFAPLSKGVIVEEYISVPDWIDRLVAQGQSQASIEQYHSFKLVLNSDLLTSADIGIVSSFMKKVKAHYVKMSAALLRSLQDTLNPEEFLVFGRLFRFFDNSGLSTPTAFKEDTNDDNEAYLSLEGVFYTKYHTGEDLATTQGSSTVSSASGGFIDARVLLEESWDPPHIRPGDLLVITSGNNVGKYEISSVTSDTQIILDLTGVVFQTLSNQQFDIFRPVKNPIFKGKASVTTSNSVIGITETVGGPGGIGSSGIAVGDTLVFTQLGTLNPVVSKKYSVIAVTPDDVTPTVEVTPAPSEATAIYDVWVVREGLMPKGIIKPYGETAGRFFVNITTGSSLVNFVDSGLNINSWLNIALIRPGDLVKIDNVPYEVLRFEPASRRAAVTPNLLTTATNKEVSLELRPYRATTTVSVDFLDRIISDYIEVSVESSETTGPDVNTTSGSSNVTLTSGTFSNLLIIPGDHLILLEGADSAIDVGHGPGAYPIKQISGGTATLIDLLTTNGTFRFMVKRKRPNEG